MISVSIYERIICMKLTRLVLLAVTPLAMSSQGLFAHEGEEHGDTTKVKIEEGMFVLSAVTENFEVVLKYPPTEPGKELSILIYLSDYATNRPIKDAEIELEITGLESSKPKVEKTDLAGVYHAEVVLPKAKPYDALLTISTKDIVDLIPINGIQAGMSLNTGGSSKHSDGAEASPLGRILLVGVVLALLAGAAYVFYNLGKRRAVGQHS